MDAIPVFLVPAYLRTVWFRPAAELFPPPVHYTEGRMRQRPGVVLVAGFGGLLLIMALAESGAMLFLNSLRHNESALQARFLERNRTLERIRSNIYLSGTFVRDSLLAPEQSGARLQLNALQNLRRDTGTALTKLCLSHRARRSHAISKPALADRRLLEGAGPHIFLDR